MDIQKIEELLHQKGKSLRVDKQRVNAQILRIKNKISTIEKFIIMHRDSGTLNSATSKMSNTVKKMRNHIASLDKLLHQIKLDQEAVGSCIKSINNTRNHVGQFYLNCDAFRLEILEKYFILSTRDAQYYARYYEFGDNW